MTVPDALTDVDLTEILGPKCPACGWRDGKHRPAAGDLLDACPTTDRSTP